MIAYLVPGATTLPGFSLFSPMLQTWFATSPPDALTISGFLYLTFASLAAGMTVTAISWAIMDTLFSYTGLSLLRFSVRNRRLSPCGSNSEKSSIARAHG